MQEKRRLTIDEANAAINALARSGTRIYDMRGKSEAEQADMVREIEQHIARLYAKHGIDKNFPVTFVAGSGKTEDPKVLREAKEMGQTLKAVVTGGSQYSVMGAVADGAKIKIGITCESIMPFEMPDKRYDMIVITDGKGMKGVETRLKLARHIAKNELAIQGGMGTMEEVIGGLKYRSKLMMLTPFWSPLIESLKKCASAGFIDHATLDKIQPVSPRGTPIDNLSSEVVPMEDATHFRKSAAGIAQLAKKLAGQHRLGKTLILDGTQTNGELTSQDAYILPPGNIDTLCQALVIAVDKRVDRMLGDDSPNPGVSKKPLIVLNIDGIYDGFMQQWHKLEKEGYLIEPLSDLITEVKINSRAQIPDIRLAITNALPRREPTHMADMVAASRTPSGSQIQAGI